MIFVWCLVGFVVGNILVIPLCGMLLSLWTELHMNWYYEKKSAFHEKNPLLWWILSTVLAYILLLLTLLEGVIWPKATFDTYAEIFLGFVKWSDIRRTGKKKNS